MWTGDRRGSTANNNALARNDDGRRVERRQHAEKSGAAAVRHGGASARAAAAAAVRAQRGAVARQFGVGWWLFIGANIVQSTMERWPTVNAALYIPGIVATFGLVMCVARRFFRRTRVGEPAAARARERRPTHARCCAGPIW